MRSAGTAFPQPLPPCWVATPLRYATVCLDGKRIPLNADERGRRQGDYPYWGANGIVDSVDDFLFDEPLVLLGEDGAPFFDKSKPVAFFVTGKIWVNNHIHVLRVGLRFEPRFFAYALNATDYVPWIDGSTRDKLTQDKMGSIRLPTPSLPTQCAIADYLDREVNRIEGLVSAKERWLDLLSEKRRAIIASAVTRGLDPSAPMRASGVSWLGKIPAHWEMKRAKWLFSERDQRSQDGEETLLSLRMERGLVSHNDVSAKQTRPEELVGYKRTSVGELVINRMRASMGLIAVTPQDGLVSPDYAVFVAGPGLDARYYEYLFRTDLMGSVFRSESTGLGTGSSGFLRLYSENFLALWLPYPRFEEQNAIVDHIARETAKSDNVRAATERTISLLKERRAALIAAAVTGQIDTGGAA